MSSPSSFFSHYHKMFRRMNYPTLDITKYSDGSWDIIEVIKQPHFPSETQFRTIYGNFKHLEISYGFVKKLVESIDITRKEIWDREAEKTKAMYEEGERAERAKEDRVNAAFKAIKYNPDLMERIMEKGLGEMNLEKIARNISTTELAAQRKSYNSMV